MKDEIYEIPYRAELCYNKNKGVILPEGIPYIGMGASNIATSTFRYLEIDILAEKAAEYYNYLIKYKKPENGVLISQSGQSQETLWCADYFKSFVAIVNSEDSPLGSHNNCSKQICLYSGDEKLLPIKTYINTLLVLYLGFGFNPAEPLTVYKNQIDHFEQEGKLIAELIYKKNKNRKGSCFYILGNGPNISTARLASIVLSEVLKKPSMAMSVSQYDHAYKESAKDCMVLAINHDGPEAERTSNLLKTINKKGAVTYELNQPKVESIYSPLTFPLTFYFAANYLAEKMKVKVPFSFGKRNTKVFNSKT